MDYKYQDRTICPHCDYVYENCEDYYEEMNEGVRCKYCGKEFMLEVTAKYKSDNLSLDKVPQRPLQVALDDLRKTVSRLSPSITETRVDVSRNRPLGNG